ncbi:MAG TPA: hypothetical protein EYN38_04755, partial [Flavobacteriales bacterium]|nr:hypothetical protein [Flavobacteriales bacterium]
MSTAVQIWVRSCFVFVSLFSSSVYAQNVAINATGNAPNASALLDMDGTSKGLLIPRVTFCHRVAPACPDGMLDGLGNLAAAAQGLLVYQTDAGTDGQGFYYNTSSTTTPAWVKLFGGTPSSGWELTGNAGTTTGTNFLGTTDAVDLAIYTNNTERIRVNGVADPNEGFVGIGTSDPGQMLDVAGDVEIGGGAADYDGTDEFLHINSQNQDWYIGVKNLPTANLNDFHIGLTQAEDGIFHIEPGGNVGIGTTAPVYKLDVSAAVRGIRSITTGVVTISIYGYNANAIDGYGIVGQADGSSPFTSVGVKGIAENGGDALQTDGPTLFNADGEDYDLRAMGLTDDNLFFLDAGNDRAGIGTNAPGAKFHVSSTGDPALFERTGSPHDNRLRIAMTNQALSGASNITANQTINFAASGAPGHTGDMAFSANADNTNTGDIQMIITNAGDVGIGTNAPGTKLEVVLDDANQSSAVNVLSIDHSYNGGNGADGIGARIRLRAEGDGGSLHNIGFITGALSNASSTATVREAHMAFDTYDDGYRHERFRVYGAEEAGIARISWTYNTASTIGAGTTLGSLEFYGQDQTAAGVGARITAHAISGWGGGVDDYPTELQFHTTPDGIGTGLSQRMVIDEDGNVGIGTPVPKSILHTVATGAKTLAYSGVALYNSGTSSTAGIVKTGLLVQSTGTWNGIGAINRGLYVTVAGGTTNYAAIFDGGNVGIGTTSPLANLHVNGSATLGSILITPSESISGDDSEILFGEDDDYTFGMSIKYDGGDDKMYVYGESNSTIYGPHLSIERNNGYVALTSGTGVNEFSIDGTLGDNSDDALPTEQAVKTYVDGQISNISAIGIDELTDGSVGLGLSNVFLGDAAGAANIVNGNYNVGVGVSSLNALTTGDYNSAVGRYALRANTTGSNNNSFGSYSMYNATTGNDYNTAIGSNAMRGTAAYTNSDYNIALGYSSLYSINGGDNNVAVGRNSLYSNTTGTYNTASGYYSMYNATTGNDYNIAMGRNAMRGPGAGYTNSDYNIAIGDYALYSIDGSLSGGDYNIALGKNSLYKNTEGIGNLAVGYYSMYDNTTGDYNTAFGYFSLADNTLGNYNSAYGYYSLRENTEGLGNSGFGYRSLYNNLTGDYNAALGYEAGYSALGNKNVFIGYQAGYSETGSDKLYIDNSNTTTPLIYGDFSTNDLRFNGDVGIGTDAAVGYALDVNGDSRIGWHGSSDKMFILFNDWLSTGGFSGWNTFDGEKLEVDNGGDAWSVYPIPTGYKITGMRLYFDNVPDEIRVREGYYANGTTNTLIYSTT